MYNARLNNSWTSGQDCNEWTQSLNRNKRQTRHKHTTRQEEDEKGELERRKGPETKDHDQLDLENVGLSGSALAPAQRTHDPWMLQMVLASGIARQCYDSWSIDRRVSEPVAP
jgi:hypothetical protein